MFGLFKKKDTSDVVLDENTSNLYLDRTEEALIVGAVERSLPKLKRVDSSGKEFTLSTRTVLSSSEAITTSEVIFSCVDYIATSVGQARFKAVQLDAKTRVKLPFANKTVVKVMNTNPNPTTTWTELLSMAATQILLDGETFITMELVGKQFEFTVIDSETSVEILFDVAHPEIPTGYAIGDATYGTEEMIHVKRVNIKGDLHGQSVLASLVDAMVIDGYASDDLISLYENGSVPEMYLSSDAPLAPTQVKRIEDSLSKKYNRAGRHSTYVLPNGLVPTSLKINPRDAVILEAMGISEDRLLRAFKLHRTVLGGRVDSYTNDMLALNAMQFNNAIRPIINLIRDKIEMTMRSKIKNDNLIIEVDYTNLPEVSRALTVHTPVARSMYASGLSTLNEARDLIGLPPLQDPLANENFLPEHLLGSSLSSIQGLDETQLKIIREAKVNEAQSTGIPNPKQAVQPSGSDSPTGGTPNTK